MRRYVTLLPTGLLALSLLVGRALWAQGRSGPPATMTVGPRGGRDFENHAWSLGGQFGLRFRDRFEIRPSGDYFFGDETPFRWQLNADGTLTFGPGRSIYGGGGAAFVKVRPLDEVKTGYNIFFGLNLAKPEARSRPFAEFRWTWVNDTSPFRMVVGFNYRLR